MSLKKISSLQCEIWGREPMHISESFTHHSGHSLLTYNFLCRIPQINSQYMQEYYTIKFREIPEGLGKGKKSEN